LFFGVAKDYVMFVALIMNTHPKYQNRFQIDCSAKRYSPKQSKFSLSNNERYSRININI